MREFTVRTAILLASIVIFINEKIGWKGDQVGILIVPMLIVPPAIIMTLILLYPIERWARGYSYILSLAILPFASAIIGVLPATFWAGSFGQLLKDAKLYSLIGLGWGGCWAVTGAIYFGAAKMFRSLPKQSN